ncbi:MAG: hypothetical protein EXR71_16535 [Myxococcales bacterium]|nr:hypothetical protein [Myxococcales bacterium]
MLVDLDIGTVETLVQVETGLVQIDLTDDSAETSPLNCESVATSGSGDFNIVTRGGFASYAAWGDALEDDAFNEAELVVAIARLTSDGSTLFGAAHSASEVFTYSATTGAPTGSILLDGWDTWIWGMSAVSGELLLLDDGCGDAGDHQEEVQIVAFDPASGAQNWAVSLGNVSLNGLWCDAG